MTFTDANDVLDTLCRACDGDADLTELRQAFLEAAVSYAHQRSRWSLANAEDRQGMDEARTSAHDAFIAITDALTRALVKRNMDVGWRRRIGSDRKALGDFASWLALALALKAR